MREQCYYPYFMFFINPTRDGKALVSTCCNNFFRRENAVVVDKCLLDTWNSLQFQFQRALLSHQDWSHCLGADCAYIPYDHGDTYGTASDVRDAILDKKIEISYFPKKLFLVPTLQCNNHCYFCYCRQYRLRGKSSYTKFNLSAALLREIRERVIPVVDAITLSGGEAFYAPDSLDIIESVSARYPEKALNVFTNGTLLHRFGIKKIISHNIGLRVSFYGMNPKTYVNVTGTDQFEQMYDNVRSLLSEGYGNISAIYVLSDKTACDVESFCAFVASMPTLKYGLVHTNFYEGKKYHPLMRMLSKKYVALSDRLIFDERDEHVSAMFVRRFYDPLHSLRYGIWKLRQKHHA